MASEASTPGDREIVISRVLNAPRELVWQAWTNADHQAQWWGPRGFTTTTRSRELKPGGSWHFVMHGPDGRDYENLITYLEVIEPERLSYKHGGARDMEPVNFEVTVTFEAEAGGAKTRLTLRSTFPSRDARDFVIRAVNAIEGGKQTLTRLAEFLDQHAEGGAPPLVITRVLNAPLDRVWQAWTDRDQLMQWFGPKGMTIPSCSLDLRVGGTFHYCMRGPDGNEMWARWLFREIAPKERLEFLVSFSDAQGNLTRAPWEERWTQEMLSIVTFAEHAGVGRGTVVRVQWSAYEASPEERQLFDAGHESMNQGWSGTFEALTEYLAR